MDADGGGRTMVPLRFIAEALGYNVDWDDSTRTAIVNTDQAKQQIAITGIKVQTNRDIFRFRKIYAGEYHGG